MRAQRILLYHIKSVDHTICLHFMQINYATTEIMLKSLLLVSLDVS